jgi:hypothetical protein
MAPPSSTSPLDTVSSLRPRTIVRLFLLAVVAAVVAGLPAMPASAASFGSPVATPAPSGWNGFCGLLIGAAPVPGLTIALSGQPAVTKTVVRSDNANGSSDFQVTLQGAIPAQFTSADVLDCVWVDNNNNGQFNPGFGANAETMRAYSISNLAITGTGSNRTMVFELNVPGAAGKAVCDRAYGVNSSLVAANLTNTSAILAGQWMLFYSERACIQPLPPPEIDEVPVVALLLLTAAATGALALWMVRRRSVTVA